MMQGGTGLIRATAFLTRSIRQESRLVSHHAMRGALALVILGLFAVQLTLSAMTGAAGYSFADTITSAGYWFLTVVGSLYFCIAITEEKEEDTLPLIRMTGVSTLALLMGKSLPRLAMAILFLMVITPFVVLSITMGGVLIGNLVVCVWGLLCYAFLLSQVGLLCSVISADGRRAVTLGALLWGCLEFGYLVLWISSVGLVEWGYPGLADSAAAASDFLRSRSMITARGDYLGMLRGESWWHPQMTWHLVTGTLCFILSLLVFERVTSRAASQGNPADTSHRFRIWRKTSRVSARALQPALSWKSWYFISGGSRWFLLKLFGIPLLSVSLFVFVTLMLDEGFDADAMAAFLMVIGVVLLVVESGRALGRVLNDEIFRQTMGSLLMLPRTMGQIVYPMVGGVLPVMIPPACCFLLGMFLLFVTEPYAVEDFLEALMEPWVWHFFSWFVLTLHLGVLLSTMLRYGGMMIAIAIMWIAAPTLFMMSIMLIAFLLNNMARGMDDFMEYVLPVLLIGVEMFLCMVIQRLILRRLETVAQQS